MRRSLSVVMLVMVAPLMSGCLILWNPWKSGGGGGNSATVNTVDGQVFGTGTATFADYDTVLDVSPSIAHAHPDRARQRWMVTNTTDKDGPGRLGYVFTIRKKAAGERLEHFLIKDHHVKQQDAQRARPSTLLGMQGVHIDNLHALGAQTSRFYAAESAGCFYSLNVFAWQGAKLTFDQHVAKALAGIRGIAGAVPTPAMCAAAAPPVVAASGGACAGKSDRDFGHCLGDLVLAKHYGAVVSACGSVSQAGGQCALFGALARYQLNQDTDALAWVKSACDLVTPDKRVQYLGLILKSYVIATHGEPGDRDVRKQKVAAILTSTSDACAVPVGDVSKEFARLADEMKKK